METAFGMRRAAEDDALFVEQHPVFLETAVIGVRGHQPIDVIEQDAGGSDADDAPVAVADGHRGVDVDPLVVGYVAGIVDAPLPGDGGLEEWCGEPARSESRGIRRGDDVAFPVDYLQQLEVFRVLDAAHQRVQAREHLRRAIAEHFDRGWRAGHDINTYALA